MSYNCEWAIDIGGTDDEERDHHTATVLHHAIEAAGRAFAEVADREGFYAYTSAHVEILSGPVETVAGTEHWDARVRVRRLVLHISGHVDLPPAPEPDPDPGSAPTT